MRKEVKEIFILTSDDLLINSSPCLFMFFWLRNLKEKYIITTTMQMQICLRVHHEM
jgi:hypothetical protein